VEVIRKKNTKFCLVFYDAHVARIASTDAKITEQWHGNDV